MSDYIFIHIPKTAGRSIGAALNPNFRRTHKTIADYCKDLTEAVVRERFKFTCVRNPWDRAVSWWSFFGSMDLERVPFEQWLKNMGIRRRHNLSQRFALDQMSFCRSPSGEILIDAFILFEHLETDWIPIARRLGGPECLPIVGKRDRQMLIRVRDAMVRSKHPEIAPLIPTENYRDMYTTQESIDTVARLDSETVKRFGYTFK